MRLPQRTLRLYVARCEKRRGGQQYVHLFIIAIDGPAGSGKSTTAKRVAEALGFYHLDTGAMYRAITLLALEAVSDSASESAAEQLRAVARKRATSVALEFCPASGGEHESLRLCADGRDITGAIRRAEVSASVSVVAADAEVRKALVARQRQFAERFENVVAEGRDIGTVVFPHANLKIYLDADLEARARRRALEMNENGATTTVEEQMKNIARRDELDSGRDESPLVQSDDAVKIDTSGMTIDEQVAAVIELAKERQAVESRG